MTVYKVEDNDYAILIANVMTTLDGLKEFTIKFWIGAVELPFTYYGTISDFEFMQEGVKITTHNAHMFLWYDTINAIKVVEDENERKF